MNVNCLIVDDEPLARKILTEYLDTIPDFVAVASCQDAIEAQTILTGTDIEVIFLDIAMPKLSGMQFLKSLRYPPLVVFTTAYAEYAVEAFEVNAFDYLVKPISFERFLASTQKIRAYLQEKALTPNSGENFINIKEGRRIYHLNTDEIIYLQAYGDYVRIFTRGQTLMPKEKLMNLKKQLPDSFIQVHRSYIVNRSEIKYLEGNMVQVASNKIPVSDSYRSQLSELLK